MTDRLATLLHSEAQTLDVPPAPTGPIVRGGRRMRRRRTLARGAGGIAVLAVAAVVAGVATQGGHSSDAPSPATDPAATIGWSVGDTVYVGPDATPARMPEIAQTIYYTSAGLLVRTNRNGYSDGGAPFHFELVGADGTTKKLGVTLGSVVPSADPNQPYLVWATMSGDQIRVVVHDLRSDQDVATVDVPGSFTWAGWEAPPVALAGDLVYVGTDDTTEVVNWRTGQATTNDVVPGSTLPEVHGGHVLLRTAREQRVLDVASGRVLLRIPTTGPPVFPEISPDGGFVMVDPQPLDPDRVSGGGPHTEVYDVATGGRVLLPPTDWGWSATGDEVFHVDGSLLTTCSTTTGDCHDSRVPPVGKKPDVRYGGFAYES